MTNSVLPGMKLRWMSAALALALAASACGGGAATPTATKAPAATSTSAPAATATRPPATKTPLPSPTALPEVKLKAQLTNDAGGFAFKPVSGYFLDNTDGFVQMDAPEADPDTGPTLLLVGGPNRTGFTFEKAFEAFTEDMEDVSRSNELDGTVDGVSARMADFTATTTGGDIAGRIVVAVTDDAQQVFIQIGVTSPEAWDEFAPVYDAVLDTVRLYEPVVPETGTLIRQWAASAEASTEFGSISWTAEKALGEPNVSVCSDNGEAWASASSSGVDWLEVYYATPVVPTEINIYESFNPSQVVEVELIATDGSNHSIYTADPEIITECPYVLSLTVEAEFEVSGLRVRIDQSVRHAWNEIDAVELVGLAGSLEGDSPPPASDDVVEQWASQAVASSQYGEAGWSANQATGEPNETSCGDSVFAWAAATTTGVEWLEVYFDEPVTAEMAEIYQNYHPGQVILVEAIDTTGGYHEVYANTPEALTECPYVLAVPIDLDVLVIGLRITVDQTQIKSWNEIDAVKLIGTH